MKLSEAIREGAKLRPQAFHSYFTEQGSCALGAAHEGSLPESERRDEASDYLGKYAVSVETKKAFPALWQLIEHKGRMNTVEAWILEFNDGLHWTREQIADWLEQQGF